MGEEWGKNGGRMGEGKRRDKTNLLVAIHAGKPTGVAGLAALLGDLGDFFRWAVGEVAGVVRVGGVGHCGWDVKEVWVCGSGGGL